MLTFRKRSDPFNAVEISSFSLSIAAVREVPGCQGTCGHYKRYVVYGKTANKMIMHCQGTVPKIDKHHILPSIQHGYEGARNMSALLCPRKATM